MRVRVRVRVLYDGAALTLNGPVCRAAWARRQEDVKHIKVRTH